MGWIESVFQWSQAYDQEIKIAREFWRDLDRAGLRIALIGGKLRGSHVLREASEHQFELISPSNVTVELPRLRSRRDSHEAGVDLVCYLGLTKQQEQYQALTEIPVLPFFQSYLTGQFEAQVEGRAEAAELPSLSYILATSRRTGSTMLCHLLGATGQAGRPGEFLDLKRLALAVDNRIDPGQILEQTMVFNQTPNGVFGAKVHWSSLSQFRGLESHLSEQQRENFGNFLAHSHYVFLRRRNKLRQAVSDWRARVTGVYHLHYDAKDSDRSRHLSIPPYDYNEILHHLRNLVEDEKGWENYFRSEGIQPLEIFYEDFISAKEGTIIQIFDFLGLEPPSVELPPQTEQLADIKTQEYCEIFFDDLTSEFDTKFATLMSGLAMKPLQLTPDYRAKSSQNVLVTLATKEYLERAKQFFSSAFHNGGWDGDFALLAHDIEDSELGWFRKRGVFIKHCAPLYQTVIGGMHASLTSKYYLFTDDFRVWETVIYSDLDAIVRAPLDGLEQLDGFAAVDDWSPALLEQLVDRADEESRKLDPRLCQRLKEEIAGSFALERRPFCAGFFVFHTSLIENDTLQSLVEMTDRYGTVSKFGDQLIMNLYFYGRWKKLNPVYNVLVRQRNYQNAYDRISTIETRWGSVDDVHPYVLHLFEPKPWDPASGFYLEWLSNLLKADQIGLGPPGPVDPKSLERVLQTQRKIWLRQKAYDVLETLGQWKLPVIRTLHFFDSRIQLCRRIGRFLYERAGFLKQRWSQVES